MADDSKKPDYNTMQAGMGILPPSVVPMYSAAHPGDFAAHISQQAMFQAQQVTQMGMQSRSFSPLATMNPFVQIGGAPPMQMPGAVPNMLSGMGPPTGMFPPVGPGAGFGAFGASPYRPMPSMPSPGYMGQSSPMSPFPFSARLPQPFFNTPYMAGYQRDELFQEQMQSGSIAAGGVGARMGTNLLAGGLGAMAGRRMGMGGAIGGLLGFGASELGGLGQFGQNMWMNTFGASQAATAGRTAGIMDFSRNFITSGPFMSDAGAGFSRSGAARAAHGISDLGGSSSFQRETGGRFNTNDLFRVAQTGAENGLMAGVGSPTEMTQRVREVAKSLRMVMELANEPDVRQAIQTMGSLRGMGMNLAQTTDAVAQGRSFARQAGMTFQQLAATGGAMGAQTFQSMGLAQGQGLLAGMHGVGSAQGSINQGILNPLMSNLVGGAHGYGAMNTAFTGQFMQSPAWAAMLGSRGGMSAGNMQSMMSGRMGTFDMMGAAAGNMGGIAGRMGVEGMGMALGMQHYAQSTMLSAMTPEQQRSMQDRQIMGLSRTMGYRGGAGFMTAAQIMGMSGDQAMARATELSDPRYYQSQRDQIEIDRRDRGTSGRQALESRRPGFLRTLEYETGISVSQGWQRGMERLGGLFQAEGHWQGPRNRREAGEYDQYSRSREFRRDLARYAPGEAAYGMSQYQLIGESVGGGGITGWLGGAMSMATGGTGREREQLAAMQRTGTAASELLYTDSSSRVGRANARRLMHEFGGGERGSQALSELARGTANAFTEAPSLLGSRTMGSIGNGIVSALGNYASQGFASMGGGALSSVSTAGLEGQMRQQYIQQLQHSRPGMTQAQMQQSWEQNRGMVASAVAPEARLYMGDQAVEALQAAVGRGARAGTSGIEAGRAAGERAGAAGVRALFGNRGGSDALRRGFSQFTGGLIGDSSFGLQNARQATSARELATAMSMFSAVYQHGTREQRGQAQQTLSQLARQARHQFGDDAARRIMDVAGQTASQNGSGEALSAAVAFVDQHKSDTAEQEVSAVHTGRMSEIQRQEFPAVAEGLNRMTRAYGDIQQLFAGTDPNDVNAMYARLQNLSPDRLREYERSGGVHAELARAARSGDIGQFQQSLVRHGQAAATRRQGKVEEASSGFRGLMYRANAMLGGDTAEQAVNNALSREAGTAADTQALNRESDVNQSQQQAGAQGLTSATDNFNRAVDEFRDAVRELRGTNDAATMNGMINQGS